MDNAVKSFYAQLESHRKPCPEYPDTRVNHCRLETKIGDIVHSFDVRGFRLQDNGFIEVSVVNWTICAGTAWLTIHDKNVNEFTIVD